MYNPNKDLPNEFEMESRVLATIMAADCELAGLRLTNYRANLTPDDFYRPENRNLFRYLCELQDTGKPVDTIVLMAELRKSDKVHEVGGNVRLRMLQELDTFGLGIDHYIKEIKAASLRRQLIDLAEVVKHEADFGELDFNKVMSNTEDRVSRLTEKYQDSCLVEKESLSYDKAWQGIWDELETMQKLRSRKTGFSNLDECQQFAPGLYLLGGLTAVGKSTFAFQLLYQLAQSGEHCLFVSFEMEMKTMMMKGAVLEAFRHNPETNFTVQNFFSGKCSKNDPDLVYAMRETLELKGNLEFLDATGKTLEEVMPKLEHFCRQCRKAKAAPPIICIDYLQFIKPVGDNLKASIDEMVQRLKNFQKDQQITLLVLSSFNRANYTQSVSFEAFKESGSLEYTADVIWGLQLSCMEDLPKETTARLKALGEAKQANPREVQLVCLKNRFGSNYSVWFNYYPAHDTFKRAAKYTKEEPIS